MPIQDWSLQATWDAAYDSGAAPNVQDIRLHYHRAVIGPNEVVRAKALVSILGLTAISVVAVVGSAYGWLEEALRLELPGITIVSTDPNGFVQSNKNLTETSDIRSIISAAGLDPDSGRGASILAQVDDGNPRAWNRSANAAIDILDEALSNNGSRNRVKSHISVADIDWGITEDVLTTLSDAEITDVADRVNRLSISVAHLVTVFDPMHPERFDAGYNWKTLAEWRTFLDGLGLTGHVLIADGSFEVL
jgi:hypothetical protein